MPKPESSIRVRQISPDYKTPYTDIPDAEGEFVRLKKAKYHAGLYFHEGVRGYDYFRVRGKGIPVTQLQTKGNDGKWHTWMVDDPMHWEGMAELAELTSPGEVLVGGLGMGLVLHHLVKRQDITGITVVEIDPKVIAFMGKYMPQDPRIHIVRDTLIGYMFNVERPPFNTAILDIWVLGDKSTDDDRKMVAQEMGLYRKLAQGVAQKVLIWGVKGY